MLRSNGKPRPYWQRIAFPVVGVLLCLVGIAGCVFPIVPGFPFLLLGFPLLFCFNHEWEAWAHRKIKRAIDAAKRAFRRLRGHHR